MNRPSREDTKTAAYYYKDTCPKCGAIRIDCMIGLEPTFQEWLDRMVAVCDEIKRVLRKDGTFWLNCGDAYYAHGGSRGNKECAPDNKHPNAALHIHHGNAGNLKTKDLLMMPARLAIALQEPSYTCKGCGEKNHAMRWGKFPNGRRICPSCEKSKGIISSNGWWVRSEIIWAKPNPMPESVTDRPTSSHEKIYLLTKSSRYYYDADAVREPFKESSIERLSQPNFDNQTGGPKDPKTGNRSHRKVLENLKRRKPAGWDTEPGSHGTLRHNQAKHTDSKMGGGGTGFKGHSGNFDSDGSLLGSTLGRNLRNVWTIATQPYPEAHFATFPEALPMKCIMAGTSERGCCQECGAPWKRETEVEYIKSPVHGSGSVVGRHDKTGQNNYDGSGMARLNKSTKTLGWQPSCDCCCTDFADEESHAPDTEPCTVLDPFSGSATTGLVALKLGRKYIGIELNPDYVRLSIKRIQKEASQIKLFQGE